jgi:hypothetical protein
MKLCLFRLEVQNSSVSFTHPCIGSLQGDGWTVSADAPGKSNYVGGKFGHVLGLEAFGYSLGHYPM